MDRFIEVTSLRHGVKIILNTSKITIIMPSHIGCEVFMRGSEDKPFPVTEEYYELKQKLVARD